MSDDDNDIRSGRHCIFAEMLTKEVLDDMRPIFAHVCIDVEAELVEFESETLDCWNVERLKS